MGLYSARGGESGRTYPKGRSKNLPLGVHPDLPHPTYRHAVEHVLPEYGAAGTIAVSVHAMI